jgi:hypothetical protein
LVYFDIEIHYIVFVKKLSSLADDKLVHRGISQERGDGALSAL